LIKCSCDILLESFVARIFPNDIEDLGGMLVLELYVVDCFFDLLLDGTDVVCQLGDAIGTVPVV
jgi:hypothetical protein